MELTEARIRACRSDEELFEALSAALAHRLPNGEGDDLDLFVAQLRALPRGLRAMAATNQHCCAAAWPPCHMGGLPPAAGHHGNFLDLRQMQVETMWKALWQKWTIDKPAALGDWLWEVFVVQLAAFLDRLTLRRIIAIIPVVILILAYYHRIPVHPGLMLLGDLLAYMDIFAVLFLLGALSRVVTIMFIVKQMFARIGSLASGLTTEARRLYFRHRRERGGAGRKRLTGRPKSEDDGPVMAGGVAWA